MELYQLRSFIAVAELGPPHPGSREAARQPAGLSAQIKALEDELGVALFERELSRHDADARPESRLLPEAAKVLVADVAALHGKARAMEGEVVGHVRASARWPTRSSCGSRDFLTQATERFPLLEIELHHEVSGAAFEKVRDGNARRELLLRRPRAPCRRVRSACATSPIASRRRRRGATRSWRRVVGRHRRAALADGSGDQHASRARHGTVRRARKSRRATLIEADNEMVIRSLVASGLGVALVREDLARGGEAAGELIVWSDVRLATTLQFIYASRKSGRSRNCARCGS